MLKGHGVATTAWHGHGYFRSAGLEQGFDTWQLVPGVEFNPETDEGITSQAMTELGLKLLRKPENTGKQFFAWAHYMDPHDQYNKHPEASPEFGNKNRDRYDNEIFYTDLWLGKLLAFAREQQWWKNTVLIISADHGEAFGEHGFYKHAFEIWEVLTRVPDAGLGAWHQAAPDRRAPFPPRSRANDFGSDGLSTRTGVHGQELHAGVTRRDA